MSNSKASRVLTTLEEPLFKTVTMLAKRDGVSLSQKVRDLIRNAIELDEDSALSSLVQDRKKQGGRFISHSIMKKHFGST